ncbi:hypothetical protein Tco_0328589 [Tanacetum coccineum]
MSMEALQAQEDLMKSIESFLKKFNRISFGKTPKVLLQAWDNFFEVKHAQSEEVQEFALAKLVQDVKIICDELSEYINSRLGCMDLLPFLALKGIPPSLLSVGMRTPYLIRAFQKYHSSRRNEVDINKKTENQAKMTKLSMEWKRLCKIHGPKFKVRVNTEESAVKPEPELKNTIGCNLNPSDGPGKPNSISMKTVKTKWALNQLQQPICVQLTKTVKTLKAQS